MGFLKLYDRPTRLEESAGFFVDKSSLVEIFHLGLVTLRHRRENDKIVGGQRSAKLAWEHLC